MVAGSSRFLVNYVGGPRIGSCVCRTVDHIEPISRLPNFSESFDAVGPLRLDCQMMHDDPEKGSKDH